MSEIENLILSDNENDVILGFTLAAKTLTFNQVEKLANKFARKQHINYIGIKILEFDNLSIGFCSGTAIVKKINFWGEKLGEYYDYRNK